MLLYSPLAATVQDFAHRELVAGEARRLERLLR